MIDNNDSFTWNLYHQCSRFAGRIEVVSNSIELDQLLGLGPTHVVLSAGGGSVYDDATVGVCRELVMRAHDRPAILGVCLGFQVLAVIAGAVVEKLREPAHGVADEIAVGGRTVILEGMGLRFPAMRYHSWGVVRGAFDASSFIETAWSTDGCVMAIESDVERLYGVQFHPESVGTDGGWRVFRNFIDIAL